MLQPKSAIGIAAPRSAVYSAPGKLILFGEHAVVYGATALAAAIDLRLYAAATWTPLSRVVNDERAGVKIYLDLPDVTSTTHEYELWPQNSTAEPDADAFCCQCVPKTASATTTDARAREHSPTLASRSAACPEFDPAAIKPPPGISAAETALRAAVAICYSIIPKNVSPGSLQVTINSEIPVSAGLGSSAAFSVALSAALLTVFSPSDTRCVACSNSLITLESVAEKAEGIVHGRASGLDTAVSLRGGVLAMRRTKTAAGYSSTLSAVDFTHPVHVVLVDSGIPKCTKRMVARVAQLNSVSPVETSGIFDRLHEISERALDLLCAQKDETTISSVALLKRQEKICSLVANAQSGLAALGVSCSELDRALEACISESEVDEKLGAAKITGAGGGGHLFAVPPVSGALPAQGLAARLIEKGFSASSLTLGRTAGLLCLACNAPCFEICKEPKFLNLEHTVIVDHVRFTLSQRKKGRAFS